MNARQRRKVRRRRNRLAKVAEAEPIVHEFEIIGIDEMAHWSETPPG